MLLRAGGSGGNNSSVPAGFIRVAPGIVKATVDNFTNLLAGGFAGNTPGNKSSNPKNNVAGVFIPDTAKGVIIDWWSSITARNLTGDRFNTLTVYDDKTWTNVYDHFNHHCYEQVATAGSISLSSVDFILWLPFQDDGKVYYNVACDSATTNFDQFLWGYWD